MDRFLRFLQDAAALLRTSLAWAIDSVRSNASLAVLSLGLAFVLWIFVTDTDTGTTRTGTLPIEVQVHAVNVPRGLTIADELPKVRVRVEVNEDVWEDLRAEDFDASVVLSGLQEGQHTVPVEVDARTSRGGLRVLEASPSRIDVVLVPLFSKSVPVQVDLRGNLPRGFGLGRIATEPSTVTVSGTESRVGTVGAAVVTIDLAGVTSDINGRFRPEAKDEQGFLVRGVSFDISEVSVSIDVERRESSRVLPVSPVVTGVPASGYNIAGVNIEPPLVTVTGADQLLEALTFIRTAAVDISGASSSVSRMVALELPAGVSVSGNAQVRVQVQITPASGQASFSVIPGVSGLAPDLQLASALPPVQVTLEGPLPVLSALKPSDIQARIDLAGLQAGTHVVVVVVLPPNQTLVAFVSPPQIEVVLQGRS
ncbi:MAG TPA: CdaR family protein [Dehalococcoidia bacterium]|nr:CdaR family protein [Dehalococcoidia bacterium]